MNKRQLFWLLVDAFSGLADQASDMLMLYEFAKAEDWDFFGVGLASMIIPALLMGCFAAFADEEMEAAPIYQKIACAIPGLNIFVNAVMAIKNDNPDDEAYGMTRLLEALLEAGPQTLLQSFVALRRPEGLNKYTLYTSICLSLFSVSKTLATLFVIGRNKDEFDHYPTKVRMFILTLTYVLCEMVSRVFSIALLGYFSRGYFIAGYGSGEILITGVLCWLLGEDFEYAVLAAFFMPFTSLGCTEKFTFKVFLCLRLFTLALYAVTPHITKFDDVEFIKPTDDDIPAIFFGLMVIATTIWVLIMPAFVNSTKNLDMELAFSYKPDRFTSWYYPLEVKKYEGKGDDSSAKGCCSCIYKPKVGQVADEAVDVATMAP